MKNSKWGFTLIELLVVVLIIGILVAVALPQYQLAVLKSRYTQMQTLGKSFRDAERAYYWANGKWTNKLNELDIEVPGNFVISENKEHASFGKMYFNVWIASSGKSGAVTVFYDNRLEHVVYLENRGRYCRAKKNDKLAHSVCKSFGGKYNVTYEDWDEYTMP